MMNLTDDTPITDLLNIFLTDKYKRIKDDIIECYRNLYISDLKEYNNYEISHLFSDMMIECVKPENKPLTYIFVKNHSKEIIDIIKNYINNNKVY